MTYVIKLKKNSRWGVMYGTLGWELECPRFGLVFILIFCKNISKPLCLPGLCRIREDRTAGSDVLSAPPQTQLAFLGNQLLVLRVVSFGRPVDSFLEPCSRFLASGVPPTFEVLSVVFLVFSWPWECPRPPALFCFPWVWAHMVNDLGIDFFGSL